MKREEYVSPRADILLCDSAVQTLTQNSGSGEGSAVLLSWLVD